MTKQKTISSLSIAAIALVAAAVPALAQEQTESADMKSMNGATSSVVAQTIASNLESSALRKSRAVTPKVEPATGNAAHDSKRLSLSAFNGQNNFTSVTSSIEQVTFKNTAIDPEAKRQFRADETETDSNKHVAFVSSRGQKLPE